MTDTELKMTAQQRASLLDAALGGPHPLAFLDSAVMTLEMVGRHEDGTAAAWIGCLYAEGEIELLMGLRAAWRRGEDRSPAEAARRTADCED